MSSALQFLIRSIQQPLLVVDVAGTADGSTIWEPFREKLRVFSFRPVDKEGGGTVLEHDGQTSSLAETLWRDDSGIDLAIAEDSGQRSARRVLPEASRRFPALRRLRPVGQTRAPSISLDAQLAGEGISRVHALRLHVIGSQLEILQGAERSLRDCLVVDIAVGLNPVYAGEALFGEIDLRMRNLGFTLWRFAEIGHYTEGLMGEGGCALRVSSSPGVEKTCEVPLGQVFWADAIYIKSGLLSEEHAIAPLDAVAAAALVSVWKFWDLASAILRRAGEKVAADEVLRQAGMGFETRSQAEIPASRFKSNLVPVRADRIETDFRHGDGHFVYGPYVKLPYGEYLVSFLFAAQGLDAGGLESEMEFDVTQSLHVLASAKLSGASGAATLARGGVDLKFFNRAPSGEHEFRISKNGQPFRGRFKFFGVKIVAVEVGESEP